MQRRSDSKEEDLLGDGLFFYWRFEIVIQAENCWENSDKCFCSLVETSNQNTGSENSYFWNVPWKLQLVHIPDWWSDNFNKQGNTRSGFKRKIKCLTFYILRKNLNEHCTQDFYPQEYLLIGQCLVIKVYLFLSLPKNCSLALERINRKFILNF